MATTQELATADFGMVTYENHWLVLKCDEEDIIISLGFGPWIDGDISDRAQPQVQTLLSILDRYSTPDLVDGLC